jgi:DNA-directed RNA polymerase specialized sigma24 family protein
VATDLSLDAELDELMPRMRSFALRMLAHPEDAEDAVQESTVATWLFSILTRVCIDRLRARRRYLWNAQDITRTSDEVDHSLVGVELRREDARFEAREHTRRGSTSRFASAVWVARCRRKRPRR